jgi:hypothetical protein
MPPVAPKAADQAGRTAEPVELIQTSDAALTSEAENEALSD